MRMIPRKRPARPRGTRGFTLAEVIAGTALSLMLLVAVHAFQRGQTRALAAQNAYNESQTVTRSVMDLVTRELRMAAYDPADALPTSPGPDCPGVKEGIVEASRTRIRFRQDLDGDGAIAGTAEDVTYELVGDELRRTDGAGAPVALVGSIPAGGFELRYYNGGNPPVELVPGGEPAVLSPGERNCVAKVRVTVRADVPNPDPANPQPLVSIAESEVAIRNRSLQTF
jgi:type II secretory pathway component PulJ